MPFKGLADWGGGTIINFVQNYSLGLKRACILGIEMGVLVYGLF